MSDERALPNLHDPRRRRPPSVDGMRLESGSAILVVDDREQNLVAMAAALRGTTNGDIVTARSGGEALRQLLRRDFAVLLLDVSMPGMDGYETARVIRRRERNRRVPIIFITANYRDRREIVQAYELGAVDFLLKPIEPVVLRAKVSMFVELKRRTEEIARQAVKLQELERLGHQRQLEAQRRELEAAAMTQQVNEARKNASHLAEIDRRKDEFLAMLGHEVRTPLAAMTAGLELMSMPDVAPDTWRRTHSVMGRQLSHLIRLVDDLLDASRIRTGRVELSRQHVRLRAVLENAMELARPELNARGHEVVLSQPEHDVWLHADPVRIVQAIANLLNNAARYTPSRGNVTLSASCDGGDRVEIRVRDNGCGIEPELLKEVFELFVQQTPCKGGLGLGLPLAKHLIELHGGTLRARSRGSGQGTEMIIELPVWAGPVAHDDISGETDKNEQERRAIPRRDRLPAVVVIEDDDDLRATLRDLLTVWGHEVQVAETGAIGLEILREHRPDIALVDIGLPDMDGCDLVQRALDELGRSTRFIALTGFAQPEDQERVERAGFDYYLSKPPDISALRRTLGHS